MNIIGGDISNAETKCEKDYDYDEEASCPSSDDSFDDSNYEPDEVSLPKDSLTAFNATVEPPDSSNDAKLSSPPNISTQDSENEESRSKGGRGGTLCIFCEKLVLNFARHLNRHHGLESEVKVIFSFPANSSDRKQLISALRKKGNYFLTDDSIKVKPVKRSLLNKPTVPCDGCLGFYASNQLYRHKKICPNLKKSPSENLYIKHLNVDSQLVKLVFPKMRPDEVSTAAKKDRLICCFGAKYMQVRHKKQSIHVVSKKMRELARLLMELRRQNSDIKNMFYALQPKYYKLIMKSARTVAIYNSKNGVSGSSTYALNLGASLKQCCELAIKHVAIRKEMPAQYEQELKIMTTLIASRWRFDVGAKVGHDLNLFKPNKVSPVPLTNDLMLLKSFLTSASNKAVASLEANNKDEESFINLTEMIFCRLVLLNSRRPGEVQQLYLRTYQDIAYNCEEECSNDIALTEKILISKFKSLVIHGVPVLFSPDIQEHIEVLINTRQHFISQKNIYLFSKPGFTSSINGYKVLRKYASLSGMDNPRAITCTRLRRHMATVTQLLTMSEDEMEQLASFIGIKKLCSLADEYETAKMFKLLLLVENGTADEFKGKRLEEIDIDLTEEVSLGTPAEENVVNVKKPRRILVPWTEEQRSVVTKFFAKNIETSRPPKRDQCESLKSKYPELLANKDWLKIKVFIQNKYVKK